MKRTEFPAHLSKFANDRSFTWSETIAFLTPLVSFDTRRDVTQWKENFRLSKRAKNTNLCFDIALFPDAVTPGAKVLMKWENEVEELGFVEVPRDEQVLWEIAPASADFSPAKDQPAAFTMEEVKFRFNKRQSLTTVDAMLAVMAASVEVYKAVDKKRAELAIEMSKLEGEPLLLSYCIVSHENAKTYGLQIIGARNYAIINLKLNRKGLVSSIGPISKPTNKPSLAGLVKMSDKTTSAADMMQFMALHVLDNEAYRAIDSFLMNQEVDHCDVYEVTAGGTDYDLRVFRGDDSNVWSKLALSTEQGAVTVVESAKATVQATPAERSEEPEQVRPFTLSDLGRRPGGLGSLAELPNKLNWQCVTANLGRRLSGSTLRAIVGQVGLNRADQQMFDAIIGEAVRPLLEGQADRGVWYRLDMTDAGVAAPARQFEVQVITAKHVNTVRFYLDDIGRPAPSNSEINDKPTPAWLVGNINFTTQQVIRDVALFANTEDHYTAIVDAILDISATWTGKTELVWSWRVFKEDKQPGEDYKVVVMNSTGDNGPQPSVSLHYYPDVGLVLNKAHINSVKEIKFPLESYYNTGLSVGAFSECVQNHSVSDEHALKTLEVFMARVSESVVDTKVPGAIIPPITLTPPTFGQERVVVSVGSGVPTVVMTLGLINGRLSSPDSEMPRYHTRHRVEQMAQANKGAEMPQPDPVHVHDVLVQPTAAPVQEEAGGRLLFERVTANKAKEYIGMVVTGQPLWKMTQMYQFISTMAVVSDRIRFTVDITDVIVITVVDTARTMNNCVAELTLAR